MKAKSHSNKEGTLLSEIFAEKNFMVENFAVAKNHKIFAFS